MNILLEEKIRNNGRVESLYHNINSFMYSYSCLYDTFAYTLRNHETYSLTELPIAIKF